MLDYLKNTNCTNSITNWIPIVKRASMLKRCIKTQLTEFQDLTVTGVSFLLLSESEGVFSEVTDPVCPGTLPVISAAV